MNTFTAFSSHGSITANIETGEVIDFSVDENDTEEYLSKIAKFDVDRYKANNPVIVLGQRDIDILAIGFWLQDGTYDDPAEDYEPYHLLTENLEKRFGEPYEGDLLSFDPSFANCSL